MAVAASCPAYKIAKQWNLIAPFQWRLTMQAVRTWVKNTKVAWDSVNEYINK